MGMRPAESRSDYWIAEAMLAGSYATTEAPMARPVAAAERMDTG